MEKILMEQVPLGSDLLDKVWELYRRNSRTLGFLPRGALDAFAQSGCVLAELKDGDLLGYVAWRRSKGEVVLVHLCVAEEYRGTDCAERLLREVVEKCRDATAIRLRCRKDYTAANRLWPKYGFIVEREILGRGSDQEFLYEWRRSGRSDAPLLQAIKDASPRAGCVVAIDANVFFDMLEEGEPHHDESSALLADWIDDVEICVTRELRNEISRQPDAKKRQRAQRYIQQFKELDGRADDLDSVLKAIDEVLPEAISESDHSDRRQLAHAKLDGAHFFATRDGVLLDHARNLSVAIRVHVLRPSDVIARIQGDFMGKEYEPIRLHGTKIERRRDVSEADLLPFQDFVARESKAEWLGAVRAARSSPERFTLEVLGVSGESPRVALATDRSPESEIRIHFLRALSGPLTGTLLRRLLADVIESARESGKPRVSICAPANHEIQRALDDLEFKRLADDRYVRYTLPGVFAAEEVCKSIRGRVPEVADPSRFEASQLEASYWPLKVTSAGIQNYIIPIRPHWAAELFDPNLAAQELFGVPERPALALENVYYSASNVRIPSGSRIIWYVSGAVNEVRAVSVCLGTDTDSAANLSRRHHRFGAYRWRDVLAAASGDPQGVLHAYRFARTELMAKPLTWRRLEALILQRTRTRNRVQSPQRISEALFFDIYNEGMSVDE